MSAMSPDQPPPRRRIRRAELLNRLDRAQADSGLRHDLAELSDDTTDDDLNALYEQYATHIRPLITQTSDHKWRAQYPGVDWHVVADSEEAAGDDISKEALRRIDAGEPNAQPPHDLLKRHLRQPIPGVYALDRELFLYLRSHVGVAQTQQAFEEAERRRAAGQSYTKNDYFAENPTQDEG
ncbi:MAG: hypothetical protein WBO08_15235 [Mycobacterium sp.]